MDGSNNADVGLLLIITTRLCGGPSQYFDGRIFLIVEIFILFVLF